MIKKIGLTLIATLFSVLGLFAQKNPNPKFDAGWEVGGGFGATFASVSFASTLGNYGVKTKLKQGYCGGIAVRYISEKNLGLIAELNFTQVGWQENYEKQAETRPIYSTFQHYRELDYIELPLLTHIYFGRKVRFFFNLGPKIGYLIGQKEYLNQNLIDYLAGGSANLIEVTDQYYHKAERKFDYGIMGGAGLEFHTKIGSFCLEGRYYYGLSDIYNDTKDNYFAKSANNIISGKLTYFFKLF